MLVGENYIEAEGIGTVKLYWQEMRFTDR